MNIFCDSSVLVAGCVAAHPHFSRASLLLQQIADHEHKGVCSTHSLAEVYSALTNLPVSPRITPFESSAIIAQNIESRFKLIQPSSDMYKKAISLCVAKGLSGGVVYDALLIECARSVTLDWIYTFNVKHFRLLAPELSTLITAP